MKKRASLLVFDTHPIQYRAPLFQEMNRVFPGKIEVVYASDFSVKGLMDKDFGQSVKWDTPLLEGHDFVVLNSFKNNDFSKWNFAGYKEVFNVIKLRKPKAIFLNALINNYFFLSVYLLAILFRIPVWIRIETNETCNPRSKLNTLIRSIAYRLLYVGINKAFFIGQLNKNHFLNFGIREKDLVSSHYCVVNNCSILCHEEKVSIRNECRSELGLTHDNLALLFSGKLIEKKNPKLILDSVRFIPDSIRGRLVLIFMGSGKLEADLKKEAEVLSKLYNVKTIFLGFVNQSSINRYYLAADILVLPSRQAGETWGLVVNEALNAGCGVVVSEYVGCGVEFKNLERFRIISDSNEKELADAIVSLSKFERSFDWATEYMKNYSVASAAESIVNELKKMESSI